MKIILLQTASSSKRVEAEETTKSGIILTGSAKEKPQVAQGHRCGPRRHGGRQGSRHDR